MFLFRISFTVDAVAGTLTFRPVHLATQKSTTFEPYRSNKENPNLGQIFVELAFEFNVTQL